jgi:hypothetical protein
MSGACWHRIWESFIVVNLPCRLNISVRFWGMKSTLGERHPSFGSEYSLLFSFCLIQLSLCIIFKGANIRYWSFGRKILRITGLVDFVHRPEL